MKHSIETPDSPLLVTLTAAQLRGLVTEALDEYVPRDPPPEILTQAQAATLLHCSTRTVRELVRERALPEHRVGDSPRYVRGELVDWVRQQGGGGP